MNPKISDFGEYLVRMNFKQIQTGLLEFMAACPLNMLWNGRPFSIKSNVFSFGLLLLEIISAKKNTDFYQTNSLNLLGYARDLLTGSTGMGLMDPALEDTSCQHIVPRYVNMGLHCVQESPADRPTMSGVVLMIGNDIAALPSPMPRAFLNLGDDENSRLARSMAEIFSVNVITKSTLTLHHVYLYFLLEETF